MGPCWGAGAGVSTASPSGLSFPGAGYYYDLDDSYDESDEEEVRAHLRCVAEQPPLKLDTSSEVYPPLGPLGSHQPSLGRPGAEQQHPGHEQPRPKTPHRPRGLTYQSNRATIWVC